MTIKEGCATLAELDVVNPRVIEKHELESERLKEVMQYFGWDTLTGTLTYDDGYRWFTRSASPTHDHAVYQRYQSRELYKPKSA